MAKRSSLPALQQIRRIIAACDAGYPLAPEDRQALSSALKQQIEDATPFSAAMGLRGRGAPPGKGIPRRVHQQQSGEAKGEARRGIPLVGWPAYPWNIIRKNQQLASVYRAADRTSP
jgi:hypothetical protein